MPEKTEDWFALAREFRAGGHPTAALGAARRAANAQPGDVAAQLLLGELCAAAGYARDAIAAFAAAHKLTPADAAILRRLADACVRDGRVHEALVIADAAAALDPDATATDLCLGNALLANGAADAAGRIYQRALIANPQSAAAECGCGQVHLAGARWTEARAAFERALALDPACAEARYQRALLDLRFESYAAGFKDYRAIMDTPEQRPRYHYYYEGVPVWDGSPLGARRLLVAYEQGLGNQIAMARFFDRLRSAGAAVTIETPPEMLGLMRRSFPGLQFVSFTTWQPLDAMDVHIPLMQLPAVLRVASERDFAVPVPYLRPDPVRVNALRNALGLRPGERNVGVVWHGNRANARDRWRIAPLERWAPLAAATETRFHSLQLGATAAELAAAPFVLEPAHERIADMDDTAALVSVMDLVISADTSVIHLAGSLGRPAWLPLSVRGDYRWGIGRSNSPWYPTLRIFRQRTLDDWQSVFGEIAAAFEAFARPSSKAAP